MARMKTCSRCSQDKPLDAFTKDRRRKDGLNVYCRTCTRAAVANYASRYPEAERERGKRWYVENKERVAKKNRQWFQANPGKAAEYCAKWRQADPERARRLQREWYRQNRIAQLADDKRRRTENLDYFLERERASYARNRDARLERSATWRQANKPRVAFYAAQRRAAILERTPAWLTSEHFFEMEIFFWYSAFLQESTGVPHHVDHAVPLRGKKVSGLNVPWNLQVLSKPENLKKSNRYHVA